MTVAGAALGEATEIVIDIQPGHREAAPAPATPPALRGEGWSEGASGFDAEES